MRFGAGIESLCFAVLLQSSVTSAAEDTAAQACVNTHEQAWDLRNRGKLRDARAHFADCAKPECPKTLRDDCTALADELATKVPTVVLSARDAHGALVDVRVSVDGEPFLRRLDDAGHELDPGPHAIRFEIAGAPAQEKHITLSAGAHRVPVSVEWHAPPAQPQTIPTAAWVFGGVGVAALSAWAYFALSGRSDEKDLEACKPTCSRADSDAVHRKYVLADVSLAVAVVSLGVATYFVLAPKPRAPGSTTQVGSIAAPNGISASFVGAF
jgi:hypothetical protein